MSAGAPTIEVGGEVAEFSTEHLGFRALGQGAEGPKKLKILPKPWPTDNVPPACATLLSIASKPGLLAAAGPDALIVTSTEKVRKAFAEKAGEWDVVSDFKPDVSISLGIPPLRHVVFSIEGDYLVVSAEEKGALAVFNVERLMQGDQTPEKKIETDGVAVRVLLPNPMAHYDQYMAVVLESGRLSIVDVAEGRTNTIRGDGVSCATWSSRGKAVAAGLQDGTTAIYMTDGSLKGIIPRPPGVDENYTVTGITWLKTSELLLVHSPRPDAGSEETDNKYHLVECNKGWNEFEFHATVWDPLLIATEGPPRALPPRFSATRLQNWEPDLDELLIMTTSHTDAIEVMTSSSKPLSADQKEADYGKWVLTPADDTKKAAVPRLLFGEEGDSVLVGEALDLSATEKILRPIATLEEITEAPHPLPAYMVLTHQGVLMAWWVVWNKSIEQGTRYSGLVDGGQQKPAPQQANTIAPSSPAPASTAKPSSVFGQPSTPAAPNSTGAGLFAKPAATFGAPSIPSFGSPGLGSTPPFLAKSSQPFGSTTPAPDKPAAPAFGSPSVMSGAKGAGFGAVGGLGSKPSPWATPSQNTTTSQTSANPFSAAAGSGSSGFAKFGQSGGGSGFSSFGSTSSGQTGFASLGQQQSKPAFPGLKTEPSGSTVTLGSVTGSSLPSWANTPAQGGSGFGFGQSKPSSFNTSSFESKTSDVSSAEARARDEATPTPQAPPQPAKGHFGLAEGFKLGSTFQSDGSAKDDLPKPSAPSSGSFLGSDFASGLGEGGSKPPVTPAKEANKGASDNVSTTPASPPRQQKSLFSSDTPAKDDFRPRATPPVEKSSDDAPLPPDFLTIKPSQEADDELPPLAGSPGVKVEAPSSSPEASPIDKEDGDEGSDFSDEDDADEESGEADEDEDEDTEQPSPAVAASRPQPKTDAPSFQDSVSHSPRVFPSAPTPPAVGRSAPPDQPSFFGQLPRPAQTSSLFGKASQKALFSLGGNKADQSSTPAKPFFPPPANRNQESLRSPSPVRSASTSALRTRREPIAQSGSSLSASIQQAKPLTPQPQVVDLEDEEDERMREQLSRPVEPSRTLEDFVAYQNYTGKSAGKTGHAAQIEMIYKDINGMIDALGWNARSIKSFTKYHKRPQSGHKVDRQTLEDVEDQGEDGAWFEQWTLGEIEGLKSLEDELQDALDSGRVQDVLEKLGQLARLLREKAKLMTRLNDIRRQIITRKDPDKVEASRKAPLSKEMADKQRELRVEYAQILTLLNQAEEETVLLRSRLAAHNAQNGKAGAVPTVDAVKKTIVKMTALAEKRNNDITLIESQMRKIGLAEPSRPSSSSSRTVGTPRRSRGTSLRSSLAESPFATPPTNRAKMTLSELNHRALTPDAETTPTAKNGYGLYYTPEGSPAPGNELARLSDLVDDNIDSLRETARRRKQVAADLKRALIARGIKNTTIH
ncbi:hypothetical protein EK21DRAFT_78139 [Setomelanomma holmii]|uniref:Nucleoporin Nup159/Nup146 N-terminal domain-containing protein n=1 Tax=Setomelanomma holmii TaxID=210430 RepID=A0A9P4H072_9PLEO|nr:hypothetical protein EK21DRAFT_78139 [Setomelanomma holmii]